MACNAAGLVDKTTPGSPKLDELASILEETCQLAGLTDGARFRDDEACQVFISTDAGGTALNLQSASVLVNLDLPWNPEVLDQRVARVHRLGQRSKVQVLHLVAPDSYEEQVLGLIRGKCNLFDNVLTRMPARTW